MDSINFDEASLEWRKNKISCGKGYFQYKCNNLNCQEPLYVYTVRNNHFNKFATEFDILNKNNPLQTIFCEECLMKNV